MKTEFPSHPLVYGAISSTDCGASSQSPARQAQRPLARGGQGGRGGAPSGRGGKGGRGGGPGR